MSRRTTRSRRAATAGKEHTITVTTDATRPPFDELLVEIAQYALGGAVDDDEALDTAVLCLMDALGCAMAALAQPACTRVLGPIVPGADAVGGVPVPGTSYCLDPVKAAFDIGSMVRWLDFNDTWLAAEWGHPSDNLGAILACALHRGSRPGDAGPPTTMRDVLFAMIRAYEIQGVLALNTAFNRLGLDHVILVRIASSAVATALLGGSREQVQNALSNGFLDGGALRAYRHAPNTGSRKSWAAGDATARGVQHALMALRGEMGYPAALSAPTWGFHDVVLGGQALALARPLGSYVMRNILFKVAYPAEFHAQTAAEAAVTLHAQVRDRLEDIERIEIETQESAMRIIDKTGPLHNPADRDHCLQYIVAVALIHGRLEAGHYEDGNASDPRIDRLRERMRLQEAPSFSRDYMDAEKRSIANALQIFFKDGSSTPRVEVPYPLGHRRRRREALPLLKAKFERNAAGLLDRDRLGEIMALFEDRGRMETMKVGSFMELFGCG